MEKENNNSNNNPITFGELALALAGDYESIYVIDAEDDSYVEYLTQGDNKELLGGQLHSRAESSVGNVYSAVCGFGQGFGVFGVVAVVLQVVGEVFRRLVQIIFLCKLPVIDRQLLYMQLLADACLYREVISI